MLAAGNACMYMPLPEQCSCTTALSHVVNCAAPAPMLAAVCQRELLCGRRQTLSTTKTDGMSPDVCRAVTAANCLWCRHSKLAANCIRRDGVVSLLPQQNQLLIGFVCLLSGCPLGWLACVSCRRLAAQLVYMNGRTELTEYASHILLCLQQLMQACSNAAHAC